MIASAIVAVHLATTWASMVTSPVVKAATSGANTTEPTGKVVKPLLQSFRVPDVQEDPV